MLAATDLAVWCETYRCVRTEWYGCAVEHSAPASCQYGCDCTVKRQPVLIR